jgi:hypothetical protein
VSDGKMPPSDRPSAWKGMARVRSVRRKLRMKGEGGLRRPVGFDSAACTLEARAGVPARPGVAAARAGTADGMARRISIPVRS